MPVANFVYIANAASKEIFVMRLDAQSGALETVERVPVAGAVMPLAIGPDRRHLYAALRSQPYSVACFAIDSGSGRLRHLATSALPDSMAYIATDRSGRFLLSASYPGHKLAVSGIGPEGMVGAHPLQIVEAIPNAHAALADRSNRFVFATSLGSDRILQFRFDADTGVLSPNSPASVATAAGAGPRHLAFHPNNRFAYVINELDGTVAAYGFDAAAGLLSQSQCLGILPPDFSGQAWAADIHATPDGRFVYCSERRSSTIAGFKVDGETGLLAPIGHFATESQPRGFNIDPHGRFLIAAGQVSNCVTVYRIEPISGFLDKLKQCPVGADPNWIEIVKLP